MELISEAPRATVWRDGDRRLPLSAELQQGEAAHAASHLAAGVPDQRHEAFPDERLRLERNVEWFLANVAS